MKLADAACLLLVSSASAQEMTTIGRYMQQNDFEWNPGAVGHVFRCQSSDA